MDCNIHDRRLFADLNMVFLLGRMEKNSNTVSNDELGNYIDILAESVTFDTETKTSSEQKRI